MDYLTYKKGFLPSDFWWKAVLGSKVQSVTKADHKKEHMGLTTWKHSPEGRILKSDVSIAKNYLQEKDIRRLERAVSGYPLILNMVLQINFHI